MNWQSLSALAYIVQPIVVAVTALYAAKQLHELVRARNISTLFSLFEMINSGKTADARRRIYNELRFKNPGTLDRDDEAVINELINQMDFLGFATIYRLVNSKLVISFYYGTIIRCWQDCLPYVMLERERRGTSFAEFFERLYYMSQEYLEKQKKITTLHSYQKSNRNDPETNDSN